MAKFTSMCRFSHWAVRLIVVVNLAALAWGELIPAYYHKPSRNLSDIVVMWFVASSLILPLYVVFEMFKMSRVDLQERKAILIDTLFAAIWFFSWWGGVLYALTHTVWL